MYLRISGDGRDRLGSERPSSNIIGQWTSVTAEPGEAAVASVNGVLGMLLMDIQRKIEDAEKFPSSMMAPRSTD